MFEQQTHSDTLPRFEPALPEGYSLKIMTPEDIEVVFEKLGKDLWPNWLIYLPDDYRGQIRNFPAGQMVIKDSTGNIVASLSTNRCNIEPQNPPSWDTVAGVDTTGDATFDTTYMADGNTLVLMSASVRPEVRGQKIAPLLAQEAVKIGQQLGVERVMGPFRPSGYGEFKKSVWDRLRGQATQAGIPVDLTEYDNAVNFDQYCASTRDDGQPIDPWLRSLSRLGMKPNKSHPEAMKVEVSMEDFKLYKSTYHPESWFATAPNRWECGETGAWRLTTNEIGQNVAVYTEANMWGTLYEAVERK